MHLKFKDGVEFNTSGPLRVVWQANSFYVIGQETLAHAGDTYIDAHELLRQLQQPPAWNPPPEDHYDILK
jgi:hypothetical protein